MQDRADASVWKTWQMAWWEFLGQVYPMTFLFKLVDIQQPLHFSLNKEYNQICLDDMKISILAQYGTEIH